MKKLTAILLSLILVLSLCACAAEPAMEEKIEDRQEEQQAEEKQEPEQEEEPEQEQEEQEEQEEQQEESEAVENPTVEYSSLDELNAACHTKLIRPEELEITDECFTAVDCGDYTLAQYDFLIAGVKYSLRSAPTSKDISGCYADGKPVFIGPRTGDISYAEAEDLKLARWFDISGQFCIIAENAGDSFSENAEKIYAEYMPGSGKDGGDEYIGLYHDTENPEITLLMEDNDGEGYRMLITRFTSDTEYTTWEMSGRIYEDGLICYHDCTVKETALDASGNQTEKVLEENGEGFLSPGADGIHWWESQEEGALQCIFVKDAE